MSNETAKVEALTVRLPEDVSDTLRMIAKIEGTTLNALIFEGVLQVVQTRKADPEFRTRVSEYKETLRGVYESLLADITDEMFDEFEASVNDNPPSPDGPR